MNRLLICVCSVTAVSGAFFTHASADPPKDSSAAPGKVEPAAPKDKVAPAPTSAPTKDEAKKAPASAPAPTKDEAKKAPAPIPPKPTPKVRLRSFKLDSTPSTAAVYSIASDGTQAILGYTPLRTKLPEGAVTLSYQLSGYAERRETLEVGRRTRAHSVVLVRMRIGTLDVSIGADPGLKGATVSVDGVEVGFAPTTTSVKEGRYLVEIAHPERIRYKIWLDIRDGERVVLAPVLAKAGDPKTRAAPTTTSTTKPTPKVYSLRVPSVDEIAPKPPAVASSASVTTEANPPANAGSNTATPDPTVPTEVAVTPSVATMVGEEATAVASSETKEAPTLATSTAGGDTSPGTEEDPKVSTIESTLPELAPTSSRLRIEANVEEAAVQIDGKPVGTAPLAIDVPPGSHRVTVTRTGHVPFELAVVTSAGMVLPVTAALSAIDMGALELDVSESEEEEALEHHMALAVGALPLRRGQFAMTAALGYPNYAEVGAALGVGRATTRMWDARVGARTGLANWDVYGGVRLGLLHSGPFSLGVQGRLGGGAGSNSKKSLWVEGGILGSVVVRSWFSLTAGMTLEAWSDRICPEGASTESPPSSGPRVCTASATMADLERAVVITGADSVETLELGSRDLGARAVFSAAVDIPIDARWSLFGFLASAPGQRERALHTNLFNSPMLGRDRGFSLSVGGMARF